MKSTERNEVLKNAFETKIPQLKKLVNFLVNNSQFNHDYQLNNLKGSLNPNAPFGDNFRRILLECLYTSSQPSLKLIGKAMKDLEPLFMELNYTKKINQNTFFAILEKHFNTTNMDERVLFESLYSIPGMGLKIAALTVRNLNLTFKYDLLEMEGYKFDENKLMIAVDVIITSALNQILEKKKKNIKFEASRDFYLLNELFRMKSLNPDSPIIFEDLWFWGFYNQTNGSDKVRNFNKFNPDKLYAEKYNFARDFKEIESLSEEFRAIINHEQ